jgi:hypothetical protein
MKTRKPNLTRAFIVEKLGGTEAAAARLKKSEGAVRMWAHRKRLPRQNWPEILEAYHNVTLGDLKALEEAA